MSLANSRTMSRDHKSMESPMCHSGAPTRRATLLAAVSIAAACTGQAPFVPLTPDLLRAVEPAAPAVQKGQTATLLPTGQWLLVGGEDAGRPTAAAMLLDATTSSRSRSTRSLTRARATRRPFCPTARCWSWEDGTLKAEWKPGQKSSIQYRINSRSVLASRGSPEPSTPRPFSLMVSCWSSAARLHNGKRAPTRCSGTRFRRKRNLRGTLSSSAREGNTQPSCCPAAAS